MISYSEVFLIPDVHLKSECPRKNDTKEDIVLSEEEAKFKIPLAIDSLACH